MSQHFCWFAMRSSQKSGSPNASSAQTVGVLVGVAEVGWAVGFMVGLAVGFMVGLAVGFMVGLVVGLAVGFAVGLFVQAMLQHVASQYALPL